MTKRVLRRLLETFFRRWWLYLIPVVLFTGVGVATALGGSTGYRSTGVVSVASDTVLSQLSQVRGEGFGYDTPAIATSRTINSLIGTERFLSSIIDKAGVADQVESGVISPLQLRQTISANPAGDQLVRVVAETEFPELSAALATATIDAYIDYVVEGKVSQSRAAEDVFREQITVYQEEAATAQDALQSYAEARPGGSLEERPLDQQLAIQQMQADVASADERLAAAQQKYEDARSVSAQAEADVHQQLRIHDEPRVPLAPVSQRKEDIMTVGLFIAVGLVLSAALVGLGMLLDRTLRTADDVEHVLGVKVVAVVPDIAA